MCNLVHFLHIYVCVYTYVCMCTYIYTQLTIFIFFFLLFRAIPAAYVSCHTRGWIGATAATLCKSYMRFSTHCARPGMEHSSSWILIGSVTHWATTGTPNNLIILDVTLNKPKNQYWSTDRSALLSFTNMFIPRSLALSVYVLWRALKIGA